MKKRIAWYGTPLIMAGVFVFVQVCGSGATVAAANGPAGAKATPMHSPVPGVCLGWFVQQQQGQQAGSPIKPGGQQTGGAGVTIGHADKTPPPTPEQMADICNKRATLSQQQTKLQDAVASDHTLMQWAGSDFQKNASDFNEWANRLTEEQRNAIEEQAKGALNMGGAALSGDVEEFLSEEIKWAASNAYDAATGQLDKAKLNNLTKMNLGELKILKREQDQMKQDVLSLKSVSAQLQGLAPCDTTKLVKKEPTQESSSAQQVASKAAAPAATATAAKGGSHALMWILGGGAAAGGAAYAAGKLIAGACSNSQAIADLEQEQQLCTANTVACQNAANQSAQAVTSYCSCLGKAPPGASTTIDQELAALQSGAGCQ